MSLLRTAKSTKLGSQRLSAYNKEASTRSSEPDTNRSSTGSSYMDDNNSSIADSKWQFSEVGDSFVGGSFVGGSLATSVQTDEEIKDILRKATANALGRHQEDNTTSTSSIPSVMRTLSMGSGGSSNFSVSKAYGAAKQVMKENKSKTAIPLPITTIDTSSVTREKVTVPLDKNISMASHFSISIQREEVQRGKEHAVPSKLELTQERATQLLKEDSKKRVAKLLQKLDKSKKDRCKSNHELQKQPDTIHLVKKTQKQKLLERLEKMGVKPEEVGLGTDGTSTTKSKKSSKSKKKSKSRSTNPSRGDDHIVDVKDKYVPNTLNEDFMQDVMALAAGHLGGIDNAKSMDEILNAKEAQPDVLHLLVKPESADMDEFISFASTKRSSQKTLLAKAKAARTNTSPSLAPSLPKIPTISKSSKPISSLTDADWVAQDLRRKNEMKQELDECTTECSIWSSELFEENNEVVASRIQQPRLLMYGGRYPSTIESSPSKTLSERRAAIAAKSKTFTTPPVDDEVGLDSLGDALTIASSTSERYISSESSIIERKESFADKATSKAISHLALTKKALPEDHATLFCDALENAVAPSISGSSKQGHHKHMPTFDGDDKSTTNISAFCVSFNRMVPKSQSQQPPPTIHSTLSKISQHKAINAIKDTKSTASSINLKQQESLDESTIEKKESFVEKASSKAKSHKALIKKFSTTDPTTALCDALENAVAPSHSGSVKQNSTPVVFDSDDGSTTNTSTWCVSLQGMANSAPCSKPSVYRPNAVTPTQQGDGIFPEEHAKVEWKSPNSILDIGTLSQPKETTVAQVDRAHDTHHTRQTSSPTNLSRKSDFLGKGSLLDQDDAFWDTLSTIASSAPLMKKEEFTIELHQKLEDIPEEHIVTTCGVRCPWNGHKSSTSKTAASSASNNKKVEISKPLEDDYTAASDFSAPPSIPVEITYRASNDDGIAGRSMIGKYDSVKGVSREDQPVGKTMENLQTLLSGDSSSCDSSVLPLSMSPSMNRKDEGNHVTAEELELAMIRGLEMATAKDEVILKDQIPSSPLSMKRISSKYGEDDQGEQPLLSPSLPSHDSDSRSARNHPVDELDEIIGKIDGVNVAVFASSSNSDSPKIEVTHKQKNTRLSSMLAKFQNTTRNMNLNSAAFSDDESEDTMLASLNQEMVPSKPKIFDLGTIDKILMDGGDDVSFDTSALLLVVTRTEDENNAVSSLEDCIADLTKTSLLPIDIEERYEELQKNAVTAFSSVVTKQHPLDGESNRGLLSPIKIEERFEEVELLAFLEKVPQTLTTQFTSHDDSDDDSSLEVQAQKKYKKKKKSPKGKDAAKSKKDKVSPKSQSEKSSLLDKKKKSATLDTCLPIDIALEIDTLVLEKLSTPDELISCPREGENDPSHTLPFVVEKLSNQNEFASSSRGDEAEPLQSVIEKFSTQQEYVTFAPSEKIDHLPSAPPFVVEMILTEQESAPSPRVGGNDALQSIPSFDFAKLLTQQEDVSFPRYDENDPLQSIPSFDFAKLSTQEEKVSVSNKDVNDSTQSLHLPVDDNLPQSKSIPPEFKEVTKSTSSRIIPPPFEVTDIQLGSSTLQEKDNALLATVEQRVQLSSPEMEHHPSSSRASVETTSHARKLPHLEGCLTGSSGPRVIEESSTQNECITEPNEATKEIISTPRLDSIKARLEEKRRVRNLSCSPLRSQGERHSNAVPPKFNTAFSRFEAPLASSVSVPQVIPELAAMQEMLEKYDHMVNQLLKQNGKLKRKDVSDENSIGEDSADLRRMLVQLRRENEQAITNARSGSATRTRPCTPGRGRCAPKPEDCSQRVKASPRGQVTSPTRDRYQSFVRGGPSTFRPSRSLGNFISRSKEQFPVESREPAFIPRRISSPERRSSPSRVTSPERRSSPLRTLSPEHRRVSPSRQRRFPSPEVHHDRFGSPNRQRGLVIPDSTNRRPSPEHFVRMSSPEKRRHLAFTDDSTEQARSLREQLDLARLTSQSIRTSQSNLSLELQAFKKKLNDKRMERALMTAGRIGMDESPSRVDTDSRRHAYDHEQGLYESHLDPWGNHDDVREMMISKLKHMNDAQEALVQERMRMEEQGFGEFDEDRLFQLDRAISDIRLAEQTNSDRVMHCLEHARTYMQTDAYYQ